MGIINGDQTTSACRPFCSGNLAHLEAEVAKQCSHRILDGYYLVDHAMPSTEQRARFLRCGLLHVNALEPSEPDELRNPTSVVAVRFDVDRRKCNLT
jgi:hypothetical protein